MGLTRSEQETVIRWDEDAKQVSLYSASPVTWRKLARLGIQPTKETFQDRKPTGKFYRLPLAGFRWGLKRRVAAAGGGPRGFARAKPVNHGTPQAQTGG